MMLKDTNGMAVLDAFAFGIPTFDKGVCASVAHELDLKYTVLGPFHIMLIYFS